VAEFTLAMRSRRTAKPHPTDRDWPGQSLASMVGRCGANPAFLSDLARVQERIDARIADLQQKCLAGGVCCRFDLTGHRLYLSTGELAILTSEPPPAPGACRKLRCPYQLGSRCMARQRRPLGCRIFFCRIADRASADRIYEQYHHRIRMLHQTHWVPYGYVELTSSIMQLSLGK